MKKTYISLGLIMFCLLFFASHTIASKSKVIKTNEKGFSFNIKEESEYIEDEVIVKHKTDRIKSFTSIDKNNFNEKGLSKKEEFRNIGATLYKIEDGKSVEEKVKELNNNPNILYAEPNYKRDLYEIGINDTNADYLWGLHNTGQNIQGTAGTVDADIDWPEAMSILTGSSSVIVAVIDSGVAYNHPDLIDKMWNGGDCLDESGVYLGDCLHGYDFENNNKDPKPNNHTHGTHVAGTIAASINNSRGIAGVSSSSKIMALEFDLTIATEIKAIDFAIQNGAKIINASYGGSTYSLAEKDAISRFIESGGLFITASGNDGRNNDSSNTYPANYDLDNIIVVAATDQNDNLASYSNYGLSKVDVAAPGSNILSTYVSYEEEFAENFNNTSIPNLPTNYTQNGNWKTASSTNEPYLISLFSDNSYPYSDNSNTIITSPTINLAGENGATISFNTACDTEYSTTEFLDYVVLEAKSDSLGTTTEIVRWDEQEIDSNSDPSGWALAALENYEIPYQFLKEDFQFQFRWVTNDTNNNYGGCLIDNIVIETMDDGSSEKYAFMNGTSMATPHVAGLAALIWEQQSGLSPEKVKEIILNSGDTLPSLDGKILSGKRINAYSALNSIDIINPTVELSLSNNNKDLKEGDELNIIATFSEALSQDSDVIINISGANSASSTMQKSSSTVYTYNHIIGSGNGTSTITINGAKDLFGNDLIEQDTLNNTFNVDNIAPSNPIIEIVPEKINDISSSSVIISGSADTDTLLTIELESNGSIISSSTTLISTSSFAFNFDLSSSSENYLDDGNIYLTISSQDEAGNIGQASSTILKDTLIPEILSVETLDLNVNGKIDHLRIILNKNILDSTASSTDFIYQDYVINNISSSSEELENDNIIILSLSENDYFDSSATSTLSYNKTNIKDDFNNYLKEATIISIDKAKPFFEKIGTGVEDFSLSASSSIDIIFSELISSSSKLSIEQQIINGVNIPNNISFLWLDNILNISNTESIAFYNDVIIDVCDLNDNCLQKSILIDSSLEENQINTEYSNTIILNNIINEAIIDYLNENIEVMVEEDATDTYLNLSSLSNENNTIVPEIKITANNNIEVLIVASTTVLSDSNWNQKIINPTSTNYNLPERDGYNRYLETAIKIGSDSPLSFDKAVRILFPNKANKKVARVDNSNNFVEINTVCNQDNYESVDNICKMNIGSDLIIWTKNFSIFTIYTESMIEEESPRPSGGGGGGGSYYIPPVIEEEEEASSTEEIIPEEEILISSTTDEIINDTEVVEDNTNQIQENNSNYLFAEVINREKDLLNNIDYSLSERLSGKILLQVEENGEAWYIDKTELKRHYLGRPKDAFAIMRSQGIGIKNEDLNKISISLDYLNGLDSDMDKLPDNFEIAIGTNQLKYDTDEDGFSDYDEILNNFNPNNKSSDKYPIDINFTKKHAGKIFLQVEENGEAWYINPDTLKRYYLGRPSDAFEIMRNLGLGISNENIRKIDLAEI